ncbi:phytanoyl-CoA dioxygenase family protein [Larkinella rosea]|uniref:Phytanoyl-CoA dioxygenase family protein n=1 Tax=Larkinella rosea TaxID=2025312 RepID=A0A3P1BA78_9BACT|nr:phytanoyl-CoA dioxygenase family protein [Larkinella rosea]RRA98006.1 phytanoyl-CoA dioxygenase family protein [Larkinella rosea]
METIDTQALKESFRTNGYVFLPGFLSAEEVSELNDKVQHFIASQVADMPWGHIFYEDKNDPTTLKQLIDMQRYDPYFDKMLNDSKFKQLAELLLDDAVIPKTLEYFNKPPRIGKPTPPHQDNYYFMLKPAEAATMWLALEDVDAENGCVRYVTGSHLHGVRPHGRTQTLGFSQGITDFWTDDDQAKAVAFPAKAGDLLIHHSMTIHWAEANRSERTRKALGWIYWAASAQEDTEAKAAYQKKLQAETA